MRTTRSFIMRLFVDTDDPRVLHGMVRSVTDDKEFSFSSGQALLSSLSQFCQAMAPADEQERQLTHHSEKEAKPDRAISSPRK